MGNLGFAELLVIVVVALLVFGPERLPEMARQAGRALARFRQETSRSVAELKEAADLEDLGRELSSVRSELRSLTREIPGTRSPGRPDGKRSSAHPPPPTDPEAT